MIKKLNEEYVDTNNMSGFYCCCYCFSSTTTTTRIQKSLPGKCVKNRKEEVVIKHTAFNNVNCLINDLDQNMVDMCGIYRETIHRLDERMAKESLKIMRLTQTRANYVQLFNKVSQTLLCLCYD